MCTFAYEVLTLLPPPIIMHSKRDMSPFPNDIPANIFESLRNHRDSERAMHLPRAFRYIPNGELYGYPPTVVQYKHEQTGEVLQVKSYIWDDGPVRLEKQTVVVMKGRSSLEATVAIIPKKHLGTQLYTWEPGPGEGDLKLPKRRSGAALDGGDHLSLQQQTAKTNVFVRSVAGSAPEERGQASF